MFPRYSRVANSEECYANLELTADATKLIEDVLLKCTKSKRLISPSQNVEEQDSTQPPTVGDDLNVLLIFSSENDLKLFNGTVILVLAAYCTVFNHILNCVSSKQILSFQRSGNRLM